MKVDSKQPRHSKKKTPSTSKSSGQESSGPRAASTLRTASIRILSVLDPRVQLAAEKAVVASRNTIKKRLTFIIPRGKIKISPTVDLSDEAIEELDHTINQLQGEAKRDATLKRKASNKS